MTDVFYDSWAWIEIYAATAAGRRLDAKYGSGRAQIHTSLWALAEVGAKVHLERGDSAAQEVLGRMERDAADVHPPEIGDVRCGVGLRTVLRRTSGKKASLGDAVMLCQARRLGMPFISGDPAFKGQPDVRSH